MSALFLVSIEDERLRARVVEALRTQSFHVETSSLEDWLNDPHLDRATALIAELASNGAARIDVLRAVRSRHPHKAILCSIPDATTDRLDELHLLGVDVCGRPLTDANLARFVERVRTLPPVGQVALAERIRLAASTTGLSRRETELLALATRGLPRREIAEALSVSENTVKAQIRSLLKKTGARSLAVLGQQVLRGVPKSNTDAS